ncbi:MAG TPA: transposase [Xanthobacteraceae bacterium]
MSRYRRANIQGGVFFFTVTLADRSSDLLIRHIDRLRRIYMSVQRRHPFQTLAVCILPDHLHALWLLPQGDAEFPLRWSLIKAGFSRGLPLVVERSSSKTERRERGIWQRRYWEHAIRDDADLERHVDYIHFNPVKHGHVSQVCDWPYSTFHSYVTRGLLPRDWGGRVGEISGAFGE